MSTAEFGTVTTRSWNSALTRADFNELERRVACWAIRPPQGKSWLSYGIAREFVADIKRRRREGQAAIAQAVNILLSTYQH
jgi:hypothetical protein